MTAHVISARPEPIPGAAPARESAPQSASEPAPDPAPESAPEHAQQSAVGRRTVLGGAAALAVTVTAGGWLAAAPAAWAAPAAPAAEDESPTARVVRDARLAWARLPQGWESAPFLGDGTRTAQVFHDREANALVFALSAARGLGPDPEGLLRLRLNGAPTAATWQLDLWNAELTGTVTTTRGSLGFSAVLHRRRGLLLVSLTPQGGETSAEWTGGRGVTLKERDAGGVRLAAAALLADSGKGKGTKLAGSATDAAAAVRDALGARPDALVGEHRADWHAHYSRGFVSVPDRALQRFHWLQVYKAGCVGATLPAGSRAHAFLTTAGFGDLDPLTDLGTDPQAGAATPAGAIPGVGSKAGRSENPISAWHLPGLWSAYRHTMDERLLSRLVPLLRRAVEFYSAFLTEGPDGRLHLPGTHALGQTDAADATADLALLRWAAARLVEGTARLSVSDPRLARWREIVNRLAPYHADDSGVLIGAGRRLASSQADPAHLGWIRPLGEKAWSRPEDRDLMRRSVSHWEGMREAWDAGSYATAGLLAAAVRAPDAALTHLGRLLSRSDLNGTRLTATSLCRRGAGSDPVVPFVAAGVLTSLLTDTQDGILEVFPALPRTWAEASVAGLRTPGAFTVDAARSGGGTTWVRVRSEAGEPLVLRHGIDGEIDVRDDRGARQPWRQAGPGTASLLPGRGRTVTVTARGAHAPDEHRREVPAVGAEPVRWGLN